MVCFYLYLCSKSHYLLEWSDPFIKIKASDNIREFEERASEIETIRKRIYVHPGKKERTCFNAIICNAIWNFVGIWYERGPNYNYSQYKNYWFLIGFSFFFWIYSLFLIPLNSFRRIWFSISFFLSSLESKQYNGVGSSCLRFEMDLKHKIKHAYPQNYDCSVRKWFVKAFYVRRTLQISNMPQFIYVTCIKSDLDPSLII